MNGKVLDYSVFKANWASRYLRVQEIIQNNSYHLYAFDGPLEFHCVIPIAQGGDTPSSDQSDYEANIRPGVNISYSDINNDDFVRIKVNSRGFHLQVLEFTQTTSSSGTFLCKEVDGSDVAGFTQKFYDNDGNLITDPSASGTCTSTVVDMNLPYNYEILGGMLKQPQIPSEDVLCYVVGAPDFPAASGGNIVFAKSVNLSTNIMQNEFDGKTVKFIQYDPIHNTSLIRFTLNHSPGFVHKVSMRLHTFRK